VDSFSLVDIAAYPWFERWCVLEHYRGFELPKEFKKLHAWKQSVASRESVKSIVNEPGFYIEQYEHYAKAKAGAPR
jgi:glutathione S-transferase